VPVAESVHEPELENDPPLVSELNATAPLGVVLVPAALPVTVAVQLVACPTTTVPGEQTTPLDVVRLVTVIVCCTCGAAR
jgi:hypothetical protein